MQTFNDLGKLENIGTLFPLKVYKNWRTPFIDEIVQYINEERVGTKYKPVTPRWIAIKTAHFKTGQDFHFIISIAKDAKRRGDSFSKVFFGSIKAKNEK